VGEFRKGGDTDGGRKKKPFALCRGGGKVVVGGQWRLTVHRLGPCTNGVFSKKKTSNGTNNRDRHSGQDSQQKKVTPRAFTGTRGGTEKKCLLSQAGAQSPPGEVTAPRGTGLIWSPGGKKGENVGIEINLKVTFNKGTRKKKKKKKKKEKSESQVEIKNLKKKAKKVNHTVRKGTGYFRGWDLRDNSCHRGVAQGSNSINLEKKKTVVGTAVGGWLARVVVRKPRNRPGRLGQLTSTL